MADFTEHTVPTSAGPIWVTETGPVDAPPVLFLHGWPQNWSSFERVMTLGASTVRALALDLPGIGGSVEASTDGSTAAVARAVRDVVDDLGLSDLTLVGHDMGGMVAYSYLRRNHDLARAVIMDVAVPGVSPWETVIANPYIWHFAFHSIPELPETLVAGHQGDYFDYFFDILARDASAITPEARNRYVDAYRDPRALTAGLEWYRAFPADASDNDGYEGGTTDTPLLYLRGDGEPGDIDTYAAGFRDAGVTDVQTARVPSSGHFAPEEAPDAVWSLVDEFVTAHPTSGHSR